MGSSTDVSREIKIVNNWLVFSCQNLDEVLPNVVYKTYDSIFTCLTEDLVLLLLLKLKTKRISVSFYFSARAQL